MKATTADRKQATFGLMTRHAVLQFGFPQVHEATDAIKVGKRVGLRHLFRERERLRCSPPSAMTQELAELLKDHKPALLAIGCDNGRK